MAKTCSERRILKMYLYIIAFIFYHCNVITVSNIGTFETQKYEYFRFSMGPSFRSGGLSS